MYKLNDFIRFLLGFFTYSIMFVFLFSVLAGSSSSHAAEFKLAGCDIAFSGGSGKPVAICTNPRFTKEEIEGYDRL